MQTGERSSGLRRVRGRGLHSHLERRALQRLEVQCNLKSGALSAELGVAEVTIEPQRQELLPVRAAGQPA